MQRDSGRKQELFMDKRSFVGKTEIVSHFYSIVSHIVMVCGCREAYDEEKTKSILIISTNTSVAGRKGQLYYSGMSVTCILHRSCILRRSSEV